MTRTGAASAAANAGPAGLGRRWLDRRLPRLLPGGRPEKLPIVLHRNRIYILPTRYGLFFGVLLVVMLLGALNYNNNLALMLTFLLGGVTLIAPVHTYRNLAGLRIDGLHAEPVFAGGTARFELHLSSTEPRARCSILAGGVDDAGHADLPASGHAQVDLARAAERRGWLHAGRIRIHTIYPLGLFRAWSWLEVDSRTLVYPAPEASRVPLPRAPGTARGSRAMDEEEEFTGLRDYRSGDPSRLIAWKALARTDKLLSKMFSSQASETLWLDYDRLPGLDREARLSRLTRWVLEAERTGVSYGLRLPGRRVAPARSDAHRRQCLEALALFPET